MEMPPYRAHIQNKEPDGSWDVFTDTDKRDSVADAMLDAVEILNKENRCISEEKTRVYIYDYEGRENDYA
jgi:hypothetical protein